MRRDSELSNTEPQNLQIFYPPQVVHPTPHGGHPYVCFSAGGSPKEEEGRGLGPKADSSLKPTHPVTHQYGQEWERGLEYSGRGQRDGEAMNLPQLPLPRPPCLLPGLDGHFLCEKVRSSELKDLHREKS